MGQPIVVTGMVLSAIPIGDYDKRVVLLTKERGKITAFAKGARRQNSQLLASMNPFAFGEFELYEGRTSYNVMKSEISNYFLDLLKDIDSAYYGFYFLEYADYYGREGNNEIEMLKLLYQSLRALTNQNVKNALVRRIFELKALVIQGEYPEVFQCVNCGNKEQLDGFSSERGGRICNDCIKEIKDYIKVDKSTFYTMQFIITTKIESLYTFTVSDGVLTQLEEIMNQFCKKYVDKTFKSLELIQKESPFIS
ncbi:DNA repair protein RecO [Anaerosacchariphilus polymeriproducens]|uniref:DNA repair protein RecO n=1 Tax=Anaerosacchariphilus polymeriproducens TaxID=1812858 RepID=A0A371AZ54_9FIRM|nr:DNA repair protein RecO [Anaerosacchariphilus polymeriproducens]RDU24841.1 DNA repair protein RecO [Anaerosacchariphilus polymeriproducens]